MAPLAKEVFVLNGDGGFRIEKRGAPNKTVTTPSQPFAATEQRRRSASVVSTASSCTLKAESDTEIEDKLPKGTSKSILVDSSPQGQKRNLTDQEEKGPLSHQLRPQLSPKSSRPEPDIIDLVGEEDKDGMVRIDLDNQDEEVLDALVYREVTPDRPPPHHRILSSTTRNTQVTLPVLAVSKYNWNGSYLKPGMTVELFGGDFLHIKLILRNLQTDEVAFRGWQLQRHSNMRGMLEKKLNEVCYIFEVDHDDSRKMEDQGMIEVGVDSLLAQRELIQSNLPRPKHPYKDARRESETPEETLKNIRDKGLLYVRWKFIRVWPTARDRLNCDKFPNRYIVSKIVAMTENECSGKHATSAETLRTNWRGKTILGGSANVDSRVKLGHDGRKMSGASYTAMSTYRQPDDNNNKKSISKQQYTYGDTFSGGGGSTRGAKEAGLAIRYAMDGSEFCIETLRRNFPEAEIYHDWSDKFATLEEDLRVDIGHLSPPCQMWSVAKRWLGKNDEMNLASLFSVFGLVKKMMPRLVTLEQTFGITAPKFEAPFNSLVHAFTSLGYSVCWQIVRLQTLGLPQSRKRLIMIAAGPGETLPDFPAPTHSESPYSSLQLYTKPRDILRSIPRNAPNHDIPSTYRGGNYHSWDDTKITMCITTDGGKYSCHPDGKRGMTIREYAALQGFPHHHEFFGREIRKQIGNAVPPMCAKVWFTHLRKHLKRTDAAEQAAREQRAIHIGD